MACSSFAAAPFVALARGALVLDDSICRHLQTAGSHCDVTVRHLLQLASGLDWTESYEGMSLQGSSVLAMLYGVGRNAAIAAVILYEAVGLLVLSIGGALVYLFLRREFGPMKTAPDVELQRPSAELW